MIMMINGWLDVNGRSLIVDGEWLRVVGEWMVNGW